MLPIRPLSSATGMNSPGGYQATLRVLPAYQCLYTQARTAVQVVQWLVVQAQLVALQGQLQGRDQLDAMLRLFGELLAVEGIGFTTAALGLGQRRVGVAQDLFDILGIAGEQADAEAGADADALPLQLEGLAQLGDQLTGQQGCASGLDVVLDQYTKLIPSEAGQGHAGTQAAEQAHGHFLEQLVAKGVAEALVDVLEVIKVEQQHGGVAVFALAAFQRLAGPLAEQQTVG